MGWVSHRVVKGRATYEVLAQFPGQLRKGIGGIRPILGLGSLDSGPVAIPDLHVPVSRPHEEDIPLLCVAGIDHRNGVRLIKAGQEVEVAVLTERMIDIVVTKLLPGGGDDGDAITESGREPLATL
jgi:hypothetical protein